MKAIRLCILLALPCFITACEQLMQPQSVVEIAPVCDDLSDIDAQKVIREFVSDIQRDYPTCFSGEEANKIVIHKGHKLPDNDLHQILGQNITDDIKCAIKEFKVDIGQSQHIAIVSYGPNGPKLIALKQRSNDTKQGDYASANPMLKLALETECRQISANYVQPNDSYITKQENSNVMKAYPIDQPNDRILAGCWPLIEVTWGTSTSILRSFMPLYFNQNRVCAPQIIEAIAHIFSVTRPSITLPTKYYDPLIGQKSSLQVDWTLLTSTPTISGDNSLQSEMAARLIRYINDEVGVTYTPRPGIGDSESRYYNTSLHDINDAHLLLDRFIECGQPQEYDLPTIITSLSEVSMVYASSSRKAWVFDGYLKTKSDGEVNTYLHAKFGSYQEELSMDTGYYLVNIDSSLDMETYHNSIIFSPDIDIIPFCKEYPYSVIPKN